MANQVVWFDIPVEDIDRAIKFYSAVLDCSIDREDFPLGSMGVLPHTGQGVAGCLATMCANAPGQSGPLLYLNAEGRLDAAVEAVQANGGSVSEPKHAIGPYGFRAIILDSEGNRIALHSS